MRFRFGRVPVCAMMVPMSGSSLEVAHPVGCQPAGAQLSWHPLRRWNFSRHARAFRAADVFVVSVPKSGRTWVRVFLLAYFAEQQRTPTRTDMPACVYTHDRWEHETKGCPTEWLRGKWLIPRADAATKPIVLVTRDPRDVMVSLFFHLRKRTRTYDGSLPALLRHPLYGIRRVVAIMNRWCTEWARSGRLHMLRYEDATSEPHGVFAETLRFLQPGVDLDLKALERAVEIASFENMRRLEAGDRRAPGSDLVADLQQEALRPSDPGDPDSYKVRRGKVGGYSDYLSSADIEFLNNELAQLDPRYGYPPD